MMLDYRLVCIASLSTMLLVASPALADGKIFAGTVTSTTPVMIPDQQVMIAYRDGTQTMVIRNHFSGAGREFAWVVPVPSIPTVTETSSGFFPTLESICAPRVVHHVESIVPCLLVTCGVAILVIYRKVTYALSLGLLFIIWSMLLPSLHMSRSAVVSTDSVTIHSHQQIGNHEVTTISSDDPKALVNWLKERQFAVDAKSESVIANYAAAKWFFCAIKLTREEKEGVSTAAPLAFRFTTTAPVYPLRLTGTHEGGCNVDLYVFGPGRAQLNIGGLKTILCSKVDYPPEDKGSRLYRGKKTTVPIVHPKLRELVSGDLVLTRLVGWLSPASMSQDARISWTSFEPIHRSVYSSQAVQRIVLNASTGMGCLVAFGFALAARRKWLCARSAFGCTTLAACLITAAALGSYHIWPKVEVHTSRLPRGLNERAHGLIAGLVRAEGGIKGSPADKLAIARQNVAKALKAAAAGRTDSLNNFTGQPRREEDSPGNYAFRVSERAVEYLWYDDDGREHSVPIQGNVIPAWKNKGGLRSVPLRDPVLPVCSRPVAPSSMAAPKSRMGE